MRNRCDEVVTKSKKTASFICYIAIFKAIDMNGVQEAAGSNPVTRTMQSVLIGSEYPVMDTLLFYFLKSSGSMSIVGVEIAYN